MYKTRCRKIWNAESGDELQSLPHKHIVKSVDFSSDSTKLLTGSNEKLLRTFDLNKPDAGQHISKLYSCMWAERSAIQFSWIEYTIIINV